MCLLYSSFYSFLPHSLIRYMFNWNISFSTSELNIQMKLISFMYIILHKDYQARYMFKGKQFTNRNLNKNLSKTDIFSKIHYLLRFLQFVILTDLFKTCIVDFPCTRKISIHFLKLLGSLLFRIRHIK